MERSGARKYTFLQLQLLFDASKLISGSSFDALDATKRNPARILMDFAGNQRRAASFSHPINPLTAAGESNFQRKRVKETCAVSK